MRGIREKARERIRKRIRKGTNKKMRDGREK